MVNFFFRVITLGLVLCQSIENQTALIFCFTFVRSGTSSGNGYDDAGSAYAQPNRSSLPPTKTAEKKEKKPGKKGKDLQPAALPLYAQVDKTKKKPREPENTYDDANNQRKVWGKVLLF